jgi:flagellar hook-associated protein 2
MHSNNAEKRMIMGIRMTGLTSGLDTESIVNALMSTQKAKKTKVENKQTKLEWKQTIWSSLNTKLKSFYTDYASKMRLQTNYKSKKATSSNSSVVTATAKSSAVNGSYKIKVNQVAAAQYVTSAKLGTYTAEDGTESKVTTSTKLADLGFETDGSSQIQITASGKTVNLNVDEDTTVADFVQSLKDAGLSASFDEGQGRFFIGASDSGLDSKFTITSNTFTSDQMSAINSLKDAVGYDKLSSSQKSTVQSVLSDLQSDGSTEAQETAVQTLRDMVDESAKTQATSYYKEQLTTQYTDQYIKEVATGAVDDDGQPAMEEKLTDAGRQALEDAGLDNDTYTDEDRLKILKEKVIANKVTEDMATDEYQDKIADAVENGLADADIADQDTRYIDIQVAVGEYADKTSGQVGKSGASALQFLGMDDIDGSAVAETSSGVGMAVIAAADSVVQVNGATLTSSNTTLDVNGLTLDLVSASNEEVTLTVANDTSAVYDSIKEFVNQYNSILADLNEYYYADTASGYDPLTDDQKEEMSDDEIEKWETKIKDSLLRRDSTLGGILDTMRSSMTGYTVTASNGKTYSLANLGITTGSDYTEYGLLHIKGDEDDSEYADETNTLESLIESDPDLVTEVLSGVVSNLYSNLTKKMSATSMSSALTFYNDKEMSTQLTSYKKEIQEWETKLADLEDRYYSQFTAMETALTNLQSQQSAISSYLS